MCGITGYYSKEKKISKEELQHMTDALIHRGPDAGGLYTHECVGLGHRRLSILDLSTAAGQPFYSADQRYVIVFNGEVYNYRELAQKHKLTLKTTSDTEVLVELFAKLGTAFVNELNGMFAIVIHDQQTDNLYIFRDRMGVKPVYYFYDGNDFIFSSELKSFKALTKKIKLSIDPNAINYFLHLGYIPQPYSIWKEIRKFPSGAVGILEKGKLTINSYWTLTEKIEAEVIKDEAKAKARLEAILFSSVEYRMISDVPLGTFLSGGVDSSLVTAIAQKISDQPVNTFSIGFKEAKFNEAEHAKTVARHLNTNHHEFYVTDKEAQESLMNVIDEYDEPFSDGSALPTYLVSKYASEKVKVVLTGDGGDESFMGYGSYQWAKRFANPLVRIISKPLAAAFDLSSQSKYERIAAMLRYPSREDMRSHIFSQEQYCFSHEEIKQVVKPEYKTSVAIDYTYAPLARKLSEREEQALFDMEYYLRDELLVKVDRASMMTSLEAREPLVDYRLFEFSLNLSEELKVQGNTSKYLLKQVLYDLVPEKLFDRPKWGFGIPLGSWLEGPLKFLIEDYLSEKAVSSTNVLNYAFVDELKKRFYKGEKYLYNRLWQLIVLQRWLMHNS